MIDRRTIQADMRISEGIAKFLSPFDTGNLRFNAISSEWTNDGFRIKYSLDKAHYIYYLEEGTRNIQQHVGFIANTTVPTIASFINAKHKERSKEVINHFKYYAGIGNEDSVGVTKERNQRLQQNLALDVKGIAAKNNWEHDTNIERYDPKFESRRMV